MTAVVSRRAAPYPAMVASTKTPKQTRNYPPRTFTLAPETVAKLDELSSETGETKSSIVDRMILRAHDEWRAELIRRAREAGDLP